MLIFFCQASRSPPLPVVQALPAKTNFQNVSRDLVLLTSITSDYVRWIENYRSVSKFNANLALHPSQGILPRNRRRSTAESHPGHERPPQSASLAELHRRP